MLERHLSCKGYNFFVQLLNKEHLVNSGSMGPMMFQSLQHPRGEVINGNWSMIRQHVPLNITKGLQENSF